VVWKWSNSPVQFSTAQGRAYPRQVGGGVDRLGAVNQPLALRGLAPFNFPAVGTMLDVSPSANRLRQHLHHEASGKRTPARRCALAER